ncbi:hypothetical protein BASA60_010214 [Batrachochytrium salamandrivorans]|nr:hypothetical protein BASA60_010214 [Batrachochytrium salamandrivorans]
MLVKLLKATRMMGDGVDHASGSKDATSLPLGTTPTTLPTTLQGSNTPDQNGASAPADLHRKGVSRWTQDTKSIQSMFAATITTGTVAHPLRMILTNQMKCRLLFV